MVEKKYKNIAIIGGIALLAYFAFSGLINIPGLTPQATIQMAYDNGGGLTSLGIIGTISNGSTVDITMQMIPGSTGKFVAVPKASVTIDIQGAVDSDAIDLYLTVTYGSATFNNQPVTLSGYPVGGADIGIKHVIDTNWVNVKTGPMTFTLDGTLNQWGRMYVLARDLTNIPSGATYQLKVPITFKAELYINNELKASPTQTVIGLVTVTNVPATGAITAYTFTVSTEFRPMSIIAHP